MSDGPATPARWDVPALDGSSSGSGYLTASHLQELQQAAHDEAYAAGYAEGLEAGRAEAAARVARLDRLLEAQARPLLEVDEAVERELVDLAMTLTRKLFRRELKADPSHVVGVVREAVGLLPVASRDVQIELHPDDAALIRESLAAADGERVWTLAEDPLIQRGGCRVTSGSSQVDARNETRLAALIHSVAGDERQS